MKTEKIMVQELEFGLRRLDGEAAPKTVTENKLTLIKGRSTGRKAKISLVILLVFAAFFSIIMRYGQMTKLNYEIADLKESLTTQEAINSALSVDLEKKTNIMKIRQVAETELGMQEPDKYQVIYIDVPRSNTVEAAAEPSSELDKTIGIINYIKAFISGLN